MDDDSCGIMGSMKTVLKRTFFVRTVEVLEIERKV